MNIDSMINKYGKPYSEELKINVKTKQGRFKWFLASILFGKRISEEIAKKTYREFEKKNVLSPDSILKTGWHGLVDILDSGGYVRYDYSTADKLLEISKIIRENYDGSIDEIHNRAEDSKDLENRLREFRGIGPITANIFLRELRLVWKKADPEPSQIVKKVAKRYRIDLNKFRRKSERFICLEAALIRMRKMK